MGKHPAEHSNKETNLNQMEIKTTINKYQKWENQEISKQKTQKIFSEVIRMETN